VRTFIKLAQAPTPAEVVSDAVLHAIETDTPRLRYSAGVEAEHLDRK
jgi:hypothetical protein